MKLVPLVAAAALVTAVGGASAAQRSRTPGDYSIAVTRICAGAVLFERSHPLGTLEGALAIARDIRSSTAHRLARVATVPAPPGFGDRSVRWISLQRRLAASYARAWVGIYETIDAARTPAQQAAITDRLGHIVHAPDPRRRASRRLEHELRVPDCTGGG